jgi:hypothetical protein
MQSAGRAAGALVERRDNATGGPKRRAWKALLMWTIRE